MSMILIVPEKDCYLIKFERIIERSVLQNAPFAICSRYSLMKSG